MQPTATTAWQEPSVLQTAGLDHRVDRLLLGRVDEAAGVDDDDLGVARSLTVLGAASDELREVALAVDGVLVAAEGDEADSHSEKLVERTKALNDWSTIRYR